MTARVIIRFVDGSKEAEEFVENINADKLKDDKYIRDAKVISDEQSYSSILCPLALFSLLLQ